MDLFDFCLRLIGAFYVFAGHVATRAGLTSHLIDRAIAGIAGKKLSRRESLQTTWLLASSTLVLAGGVALVFLLEAAAWIFVASALGQAVYIFVAAPRYFDLEDEPDAKGRSQTTNAFVIYSFATAIVLWATSRGALQGFGETPLPVLCVAGLLLAAHIAYVVWTLARMSFRR